MNSQRINAPVGTELIARLDAVPLSKPHRRIRLLGGLGYLFDTFDGTLMGYAMAIVIALWHLEESLAGWLLASVFFGYFVGALLAGVLADRFGRRLLMMLALMIFTIFSVLMATSTDPTQLFVWRMLSGIGLGAESVLVTPYLAELVPARHRSTFLGRTVAFFGYGGVLAGIVAVFVIGPVADTWWGWRIAGVIAAVPVLLLIALRRKLPESPRFLVSKGRVDEARAIVERFEREAGADAPDSTIDVPPTAADAPATTPIASGSHGRIRDLFVNGMGRRTAVIWLMWFTLTGVNYGFTSWMVNMLIVAKGFSIGSSLLFALVTSIAQIPGYLLAAWLVGRFEKKWVIAAFAAAAALSALGVALAPDTILLLLFASCLAAFINGAAAAYYPYTAEQYQTSIRTTGVGFASAVGRIGAIVSPIAIGYAFGAFGFTAVFLGLVVVLLSAVTVVAVLGVRTRGRTLEDITAEILS